MYVLYHEFPGTSRLEKVIPDDLQCLVVPLPWALLLVLRCAHLLVLGFSSITGFFPLFL